MSLTAPALVTGSELVTVDSDRAGDWQRALATVGGRLPVGWDGAGERSGGLSGYELVLAASRTLSALGWLLLCAGQEALAQPIDQAHEEAVLGVSVEFTCAVGAESPTVVGHGYDSAGQPWPHAHLVYGALAATNHGFQPLDPEQVAEQPNCTSSATTCWSAGQSPGWSGPSWACAGRRRLRTARVR